MRDIELTEPLLDLLNRYGEMVEFIRVVMKTTCCIDCVRCLSCDAKDLLVRIGELD